MHVIIVGAGIGGLCLAHGLRKAGISFAVYERDPSVHFRRQGYRIHIDSNGSHALHACLPRNLFDLYLATSNRPGSCIAYYSSALEELHRQDVSHLSHTAPERANTSVNRLTLREILLEGLNEAVHFGKAFTHYERQSGATVAAHFADGTTAQGDLLIAADGSNSLIRARLLPDAGLEDTGLRCLYGRTAISQSLREQLPQMLSNAFSAVAGQENRTMALARYIKRRAFEEAVREFAPDLRLTPVADYLMWALVSHASNLPLNDRQLRAATPGKLHAVAADCIGEWHPALRTMVAEADIPATFPVHIRSAQSVESWPTGNITLLGDAIHTMTPAGGIGANTALRDAELLSQTLAAVARGDKALVPALHEYETSMLQYGFEAVRHSRHQFGVVYKNLLPVEQSAAKEAAR